MVKKIYGVDPKKKITPVQVRDAIILCFYKAHKEVMRKRIHIPEKYRAKFNRQAIEDIIKSQFIRTGGDFNSPTKESLFLVVIELSKIAQGFRQVDIIVKHFTEIMNLLNRL